MLDLRTFVQLYACMCVTILSCSILKSRSVQCVCVYAKKEPIETAEEQKKTEEKNFPTSSTTIAQQSTTRDRVSVCQSMLAVLAANTNAMHQYTRRRQRHTSEYIYSIFL